MQIPVSIQASEDKIFVLDGELMKILKFSEDKIEFRSEEKCVERIVALNRSTDNIIGLTSHMSEITKVLNVGDFSYESIDTGSDLLKSLLLQDAKTNILSIDFSRYQNQTYIIHKHPARLLKVDNGVCTSLDPVKPNSLSGETLVYKSIETTEKGILIIGFYGKDEEVKNFAILCNESGKKLKEFTLENPEKAGISSASFNGEYLFTGNYNSMIYKYKVNL